MKIRRIIYLVLGILLIAINILILLVELDNVVAQFEENGLVLGLSHLTGFLFFAIIGTFLVYASHRLKKKIRQKEQKALEESFMSDV